MIHDWNADMDAWGLSEQQRRHHVARMNSYHRTGLVAGWEGYEQPEPVSAWAVVGLGLAVFAGLVLWRLV